MMLHACKCMRTVVLSSKEVPDFVALMQHSSSKQKQEPWKCKGGLRISNQQMPMLRRSLQP